MISVSPRHMNHATHCSGIAMPRTLDTRKGRAMTTFCKASMVPTVFAYVYFEVVEENGWIRRSGKDLK